MSGAIKSHGTLIKIGDGASPQVFTKIDEARVIGPIGGQRGLIDVSNHDSVQFMEYLSKDLADGRELPVECNYLTSNASHDLVRAVIDAGTTVDWQILLRNGDTFTFPGSITSYDDARVSELDGAVIFAFTIKIAGLIERG